MSKSNDKDNISNILSGYNPTFKDGFVERVVLKIESENHQIDNEDAEFFKIFKLVALSGVAAIILLLFSVYINDGSFTADAFYGLLEYTPDEHLLTSLNF